MATISAIGEMAVIPCPIRDGADDVGSPSETVGDFEHRRGLHIHDIPTKGLQAGSGVLTIDEHVSRQHRAEPDGQFVGHSVPEMLQRLLNLGWDSAEDPARAGQCPAAGGRRLGRR